MMTVVEKFLESHHLSKDEDVELLQCREDQEAVRHLADEALECCRRGYEPGYRLVRERGDAVC